VRERERKRDERGKVGRECVLYKIECVLLRKSDSTALKGAVSV